MHTASHKYTTGLSGTDDLVFPELGRRSQLKARLLRGLEELFPVEKTELINTPLSHAVACLAIAAIQGHVRVSRMAAQLDNPAGNSGQPPGSGDHLDIPRR